MDFRAQFFNAGSNIRGADAQSIRFSRRVDISKNNCIGCGKCAEICPGHTIWVQGGKAHISRAGCIRCFCCHEMCPVKAIHIRGRV